MRRYGWWLVALLAGPCQARLTPWDSAPLGARTPVVLLHGWNADESTWDGFLAAAQKNALARQRCKFYRFGYDWAESIGSSAARLRQDLDEAAELRGRAVALVGHSMGGLVARTYLETTAPGWDGPARVGAVYTLATPHHGSPQANLHWLAGDSRYSLLASLIPLGLVSLLDRIPITAASRTEGGRDLGWDNHDGSMSPELWNGASRFLAQLNEHLATHPLRDELLRRYTVYGGYLSAITPLSLISLQKQLREGDAYGAGGSLMGYAFRDPQGQRIDRWMLNDGAVPLESALFLAPGPKLFETVNGRLTLRREIVQNRLLAPLTIGGIGSGLDHSQMARDPQIAGPLLDSLAAAEFNLLACRTDGRLALWRPGPGRAQPVGEAPAGSRPIVATGGDRLLAATDDALLEFTPAGRRTLVRGSLAEGTAIAPKGGLAVTADGSLLRLDEPGFRRLRDDLGPVGQVVWSPDESRLAFVTPGQVLQLAEAAELTLTTARETDGQPVTGLQPVGFTASGAWLLAGRGLLEAAYRADGRGVAMVIDPSQGGEGVMLDRTGTVRSRLRLAPAGPESGRALYQMTQGQADGVLLDAAGWSPVYGPGDAWLAWIRPGGVALQTGTSVRQVTLPDGPVIALVPDGEGALVAVVAGDGGAKLYAIDPGQGTRRSIAQAQAAADGRPSLSPDGRYVALPLIGGSLFVARLDGTDQWLIPADSPVWLPQPAARQWLTGRTDLG